MIDPNIDSDLKPEIDQAESDWINKILEEPVKLTSLIAGDKKIKQSPIGKMIVYIFNKETFIPYIMNQAIVNKDIEKVMTLGPLAVLLAYILYGGSAHRKTEKLCLQKLYLV